METPEQTIPLLPKQKILLRVALITIGSLFILLMYSMTFIEPQEVKVTTVPIVHPKNPFTALTLEAKSIYVYDVNTKKVLFSKNADTILPLASLTKLVTAVTALELIPEYTTITVGKEDLKGEGDTGLYAGEKWRLSDLIRFMLLSSSNDGASAIAAAAGAIEDTATNSTDSTNRGRSMFIEDMNKKTELLGLDGVYFMNETGLDVSEKISGGYGSSKDVAMFFSYALLNHPEVIESTRYSSQTISSNDRTHEVKNTNKIIGKIPGIIGSKTGFTDLAGGNLVIAFDAGINKPIIISVLGSGEDGRFTDVEKLVWASLEYLHDFEK